MAKTSKKSSAVWESPLLWIVVLVAGAAIAAVALSTGDDDSPTSNRLETSSVTLSGADLPAFTAPDDATGLAAPTFSATTIDGDRVDVGGDGVARLYGFFAHWCSHCQNEVPMVVDWMSSNDVPAGVEIVAVSTAVDPTAPNYPPSRWFEREQWSAPVLLDSESSELANAFGLTSFPYWVAVDAQGNVVSRAAGEQDVAAFEGLIAATLR